MNNVIFINNNSALPTISEKYVGWFVLKGSNLYIGTPDGWEELTGNEVKKIIEDNEKVIAAALNDLNTRIEEGGDTSDLELKIGDLTTLTTTEKSNLVDAINELVSSNNVKIVNLADYMNEGDIMPSDGDLYIYKNYNLNFLAHSVTCTINSETIALFCIVHQDGSGAAYLHYKYVENSGYQFISHYLVNSDDGVPAWILNEFGENKVVNIADYIPGGSKENERIPSDATDFVWIVKDGDKCINLLPHYRLIHSNDDYTLVFCTSHNFDFFDGSKYALFSMWEENGKFSGWVYVGGEEVINEDSSTKRIVKQAFGEYNKTIFLNDYIVDEVDTKFGELIPFDVTNYMILFGDTELHLHYRTFIINSDVYMAFCPFHVIGEEANGDLVTGKKPSSYLVFIGTTDGWSFVGEVSETSVEETERDLYVHCERVFNENVIVQINDLVRYVQEDKIINGAYYEINNKAVKYADYTPTPQLGGFGPSVGVNPSLSLEFHRVFYYDGIYVDSKLNSAETYYAVTNKYDDSNVPDDIKSLFETSVSVDDELDEESTNAVSNAAVTRVILENEEVTANGFNAVKNIIGTDENLQYTFEGTNIDGAGSVIEAIEMLDSAVGSGSGDGIEDAPSDGNTYARQNGDWVELEQPNIINIADYMTGGSKEGELMPLSADSYVFKIDADDVGTFNYMAHCRLILIPTPRLVFCAYHESDGFGHVYIEFTPATDDGGNILGWQFNAQYDDFSANVPDEYRIAFNEDLRRKIGDLDDLQTTANESLVYAINELVTRVQTLENATNFELVEY